jgi:hypothetical protein
MALSSGWFRGHRRHCYQESNEDNSVPIETVYHNYATSGYTPPLSNGVHQEAHGGYNALPPQHTFRIFSRASDAYCLSVRNGTVVLATKNIKDEYQANTLSRQIISFLSMGMINHFY